MCRALLLLNPLQFVLCFTPTSGLEHFLFFRPSLQLFLLFASFYFCDCSLFFCAALYMCLLYFFFAFAFIDTRLLLIFSNCSIFLCGALFWDIFCFRVCIINAFADNYLFVVQVKELKKKFNFFSDLFLV